MKRYPNEIIKDQGDEAKKKIQLLKFLFYDLRSKFLTRLGLQLQYEDFYKKKIKQKYHIEQLPTIDILDLIPNFEESLDTYSFLEGTASVMDLMLLKSLARTFKNCSYLELGSWRGESIANVSEVAKKCVSIDLSDDEMRERKLIEEFIKLQGFFSKDKKNIFTIRHDSQTYDFSKLDEKFDLIFIDADHSYSGVLNDTKNVFNLRKDEDSIIVWHDYGFSTENVRYSVLAAILDGIPVDKHENLFHVSNTMCAVYIKGKSFNARYTKFPENPTKNFIIKVTTEKIK